MDAQSAVGIPRGFTVYNGQDRQQNEGKRPKEVHLWRDPSVS